MNANFRNKNRGYQQLRVWNDAIELYTIVCRVFRQWPFELKKVASQEIASADSIHRNIAEGYCRRSLREYLNFLNYALGSLGETVSGLHAYVAAQQLSQADFDSLNSLSFKLENGLLRLVESLERKEQKGDWVNHLVIQETHAAYHVPGENPCASVTEPQEAASTT
jgi:four helix bundle protein